MISLIVNSSYSSSTGPNEGVESCGGIGEEAREAAWDEQQGEAGGEDVVDEKDAEVEARECPFAKAFEPFATGVIGVSREGSQPCPGLGVKRFLRK